MFTGRLQPPSNDGGGLGHVGFGGSLTEREYRAIGSGLEPGAIFIDHLDDVDLVSIDVNHRNDPFHLTIVATADVPDQGRTTHTRDAGEAVDHSMSRRACASATLAPSAEALGTR
jgi:hypothetical protein